MKYGVRLISYDGSPMDMWVWDKEGPWTTTQVETASHKLTEISRMNPKGDYQIRPFEE